MPVLRTEYHAVAESTVIMCLREAKKVETKKSLWERGSCLPFPFHTHKLSLHFKDLPSSYFYYIGKQAGTVEQTNMRRWEVRNSRSRECSPPSYGPGMKNLI